MIEVHASSVNPVDNLIRAGYLKAMLPLALPYTAGNDVSGVITEIGKDVTRFKIGDAVFARPQGMQSGTFAEFVMVKEQDVANKPANLSHEQAASLPLVALTAWQALVSKANLQRGQKVLIHAGSGGVGSIAIQIAKHLGDRSRDHDQRRQYRHGARARRRFRDRLSDAKIRRAAHRL